MGQDGVLCKRTPCKWHRHRQHNHGAASKRPACVRQKNQLVSKLASIDVWATEQLCEKWKQEAIAERERCGRWVYSPNSDVESISHIDIDGSQVCQRHRKCGDQYLKATLAQPSNVRQTADLHPRSQSRPEGRLQHQHRRHMQSAMQKCKHRSLSNTTATQHPCCQHQEQMWKQHQEQGGEESERTSDIYWPESWPPIWGSSVPQRLGSNSSYRSATPEPTNNETCRRGCRGQRRCRGAGNYDGHRRWPHTRHSTTRAALQQEKSTVEALVATNSEEGVCTNSKECGRKRAAAKQSCMRQKIAKCRLSSNSSRRSTTRYANSRPRRLKSKGTRSIDQRTYTIVSDKDASAHRVTRTTTALPSTEWPPSSRSETSSTLKIVQVLEKYNRLSRKRDKNGGKSIDRNNRQLSCSQAKYYNAVTNAVTSDMCNSSMDAKSLQMLSTATDEREAQAAAEANTTMCTALVSNVIPSKPYPLAMCNIPKVKMQSNAARAKASRGRRSNEEDAFIIHTQQEVGESKGIEPKTGSVSRYVQYAVLKAAKLVATKGFAGLIGRRTDPSMEDSTDSDSDDSLEGTDSEDDTDERSGRKAKENRASKGSAKDDSTESDSSREMTMVRQRQETSKSTKSSSMDKGKRTNRGTRQSSNYKRHANQSGRSQKRLTMTECPTTQHRIECFRTRSGKIKCYMTARHPVKCYVNEDGQIVCKATENSETSYLPHLCDAAWY